MESGPPAAHALCAEAIRNPPRSQRHGAIRNPKSAFTLVELLVTIAIIGILSAMLLGASGLAMNTARVSRTEALVTRLHTLLSQHYDSFRHRRVELNDNTLAKAAVRQKNDPGSDALARARLLGTREQLKMELPDRWSDITLEPVTALTPYQPNSAIDPAYLQERPAMSLMYLRRYNQAVAAANDSGAGVEGLLANQGAECLYLIVMLACGDGESAGLFKESDIGDTDGDGAPEFLDGWGNPIQFLRWAPGFDSDSQLSLAALQRINAKPALMATAENDDPTADEAVRLAVAADRDPFDLFRRDTFAADAMPRGYRLIPLIYSAGPDQEFGIRTDYAATDNKYPLTNNTSDPYLDLEGSPSSPPYALLGDIIDRGVATDNIHNHLITGR